MAVVADCDGLARDGEDDHDGDDGRRWWWLVHNDERLLPMMAMDRAGSTVNCQGFCTLPKCRMKKMIGLES